MTQAINLLAQFAPLNKEIVDDAFHEFESELENEEDRQAFQKFNELYNKELEELRKEKENKS